MEPEQLNWDILDRLRTRFLQGGTTTTPYWQSMEDLATYDATYAQRIGWKWLAVIRQLKQLDWHPPASAIIDWGCGSGVASRAILSEFHDQFDSLVLTDSSSLARNYAAEKVKRLYPSMDIQSPAPNDKLPEGALLLISHVLNELDSDSRQQLLALALQSNAILWVEPGTHQDSHALLLVREQLRPYFNIIAPCPCTEGPCPMSLPENQGHWCHQFANPPAAIQSDSAWVRFAQQAKLDLRSLPYSYLAMEKKSPSINSQTESSHNHSTGTPIRIIGRPSISKIAAHILACTPSVLENMDIPKRQDPKLYKQLRKNNELPLFHIHPRRRISEDSN